MTRDRSVVVAVDGSAAATAAVEWAAATAEARGLDLRLAASYTMPQFLYAEGMVPPQELFDELLAETMETIHAAEERARAVAPSIKVGHTVAEGSPIDMLLELSKDATMIAMGSRGLGGLSGMVLGSVSAAVVSHAACPVVVIREDHAQASGPIVVGVDGSEVSDQAVAFAFAEAAARNVPLRAVHTWMDMQVQASLAGLSAAQEEWDTVEAEQQQLLAERLAGHQADYPDVVVEKIITRDRPVRALVDAAQGAQLLVVGSHGRGGFRGMLLGSTSRALLQSAPCPLVVVRPTAKEK
ncbi:universal stress protein [Corynebacterium sp. 13CS0277]|uniref:universal stress protein n=1 Tax=Corynebacterium sp. 13CS0277 TaxID=2071994 RepID=UPI000D0230F6|nr:universal stress protein [Corynebacterium sp. 13CS0277]PRQ10461.1 universal stress protein [Corynebacterium sp. 13CS0277]